MFMSLLSDEFRGQLIGIYSGPGRHYHDLRHIRALLEMAQEHAREITDSEAVEAAIWFHDAVYDTRRGDNEAESAKLATQLLAGVVADERLEFIAAMIRASANHRVPESMDAAAASDCALFLDMDLAILGSAGEFAAYERAVRLEYDWVPEKAWIADRSQMLRNFLAHPFIMQAHSFSAAMKRRHDQIWSDRWRRSRAASPDPQGVCQAAEASRLVEPYCWTRRLLRCTAMARMPRRPSLASASGL
jgi:predicted metal-dependent HD superfamily phosphohydrolase